MLRSVLSSPFLTCVLLAQQPAPPAPLPDGAPDAMVEIGRAGLERDATYLASDALGGRHTATAGQIAAADYVRARFEQLGLEPLGDRGPDGEHGWLQAWPVVATTLVADATSLAFGDITLHDGFAVLPGKQVDRVDVDGRLLFCGHGAPDDLPAEIAGDVPVVVLRTRGRERQRVEAQFMTGLRVLGKCRSIQRNLERNGAQCVVFCELHDDSGLGEMLNYAGLLPGKPLLEFDGDRGMADMVETMRGAGPALFLSSRASRALLAHLGVTVGDDGSIAETPRDEAARGHVRIQVARDADAHATNVVGLLRGSDPELSRQAVLYSAHMDHVGTRMDGDVFNGADDNASGTSALLAVAAAFAAGERPRRSVVFLVVSGEELGLWGSAWYSEHPTWPLADIVANVNIDMIGRAADLSDHAEISVTPSYRHPKFSTVARSAARLAERVGLGLTVGDMFYTRSDHYNFARKGVPVVFFCDGEHADYHQVTDTADKLDYEKIERVARLAYWVGHEVAGESERPGELGRQEAWLDR